MDVYGRYNALENVVFKPTNITEETHPSFFFVYEKSLCVSGCICMCYMYMYVDVYVDLIVDVDVSYIQQTVSGSDMDFNKKHPTHLMCFSYGIFTASLSRRTHFHSFEHHLRLQHPHACS